VYRILKDVHSPKTVEQEIPSSIFPAILLAALNFPPTADNIRGAITGRALSFRRYRATQDYAMTLVILSSAIQPDNVISRMCSDDTEFLKIGFVLSRISYCVCRMSFEGIGFVLFRFA
jgi:hypothetical protein